MLGPEHPYTLNQLGELALCLSRQGKSAEADEIDREVYVVQTRVLGAEHPSTLASAVNIAALLARQWKYGEAAQIERQVHAIQMRVLGGTRASVHPEHRDQSGRHAVPPLRVR